MQIALCILDFGFSFFAIGGSNRGFTMRFDFDLRIRSFIIVRLSDRQHFFTAMSSYQRLIDNARTTTHALALLFACFYISDGRFFLSWVGPTANSPTANG